MSRSIRDQLVQRFLTRMKRAIQNNRVYFVNRRENLETLAQLGLSQANVISKLLDLKVSDHSRGPVNDHDGTEGEVWMFLYDLEGNRIYVKLKLFKVTGEDYLKILSFHL